MRRQQRTAQDRGRRARPTRVVAAGALVVLCAAALAAGPAGAAADTTPPSLVAFSRTSADPLATNGRVSMSYTAVDNSSVSSVVFHFTDLLGTDRAVTGGATGPASAGTAGWVPGPYRLDYIDVSDGAGNRTTYIAGRTTLDLDAADFTLAGAAPIKPPLRGVVDRNGPPVAGWEPVLNSFVVRVNWSDLQPDPSGPIAAGNAIDQAIASVRAANATARSSQAHLGLKLRIVAGDGAPAWAKALDGPPVAVHDASDGANPDTTPLTVGRFWTANFGAAYQDLETKLAARYDGVPEVRDVTISRCTLSTVEPFLRTASSTATKANLVAAGFTTGADHTCLEQSVDAHRVTWVHTTSSLAFNPYQQIDPDGSDHVDETWTEAMVDYCRTQLGVRCVLANNSIRDADQGTGYAAMYGKIRAAGPPIAFQTAAASRMGSLCNTLGWAIAQGAGAVEIPGGYSKDATITLAGLGAYARGLERPLPADTRAPTAPTALTGTAASASTLALAWSSATDVGYGVACYTVSRAGAPIATTMSTSFIDAAANTATRVPYAVTAVDGAGHAGPPVTATLPADSQPPSAPPGVVLRSVSTTTATLSWGTSTDNVGVTGYLLYRDGVQVASVTPTTHTFTNTGLTSAHTYVYVVRAIDAAGNLSAGSTPLTVKTR